MANSCNCRFIVKNSTIKNAGHIFFDSPYEIYIENTTFENITGIDLGNYETYGSYNTRVYLQKLSVK
jgi:hypothetical protein